MAEKFYSIRILAICNLEGDCDNRKAFRNPLQMYTGSEQRPVLQCNQTTHPYATVFMMMMNKEALPIYWHATRR